MKTVKANHEKIEALSDASRRNGNLDKKAMDETLGRILEAAKQINREVDDLLAKARH